MKTSPVDRSALLLHLDYTAWASLRLLDRCSQLTTEDSGADLRASHGGILGTLRHIYYADSAWYHRLAGIPFTFRPEGAEPGVPELQQQWPELLRRLRELVESLPEPDLVDVLHYTTMKGESKSAARWQMILHVVNHGSLHRGQVMSMLRQLGHAPPSTDLMAFYQERGA